MLFILFFLAGTFHHVEGQGYMIMNPNGGAPTLLLPLPPIGGGGGGNTYNAPVFPAEITASFEYHPQDDGTYTVVATLANPERLSLSIGLSSGQGADPGPNVDTSGTSWTFPDVPANQTTYVNMKAMVGGAWSQVAYWKLTVPEWIAPTPTAEPIPVSPSTAPGLYLTSTDSIIMAVMIAAVTAGVTIAIVSRIKG